MRIYDIALMLMRASAAAEFVRAIVSIVFTSVRFVFLIGATRGSDWLDRVEISTWITPISYLCMAAILLIFSRPLARFAARLSPHAEIASQFE